MKPGALFFILAAGLLGLTWGQLAWHFLPPWLYLGASLAVATYGLQWAIRSLFEIRRMERQLRKHPPYTQKKTCK